MNVQAKVIVGSSSLYFADKTFDAIRDHMLADLFGDHSWLLWSTLAAIIAALLGCGWFAAHRCWVWLYAKFCPIPSNKGE